MKVPFLDLNSSHHEIKHELDRAILNSVWSGRFISGPEVDAFEEQFADYLGVQHCITVGNGLDALVIALLSAHIMPGDEVIVPAHTFIATWLAVTKVGATLVPIDVDISSLNIDVEKIEAEITPRTKAIIAVHLYGRPANMKALTEISQKYGIEIIEDAAQAHGALYNNTKIGAHSKYAAWSFYPGKNLGAFGDGGAITTTDNEVAQKMRLLRNYGSNEKYVHKVAGMNSRLDPLQAAVLSVKLRYLDKWNKRRKEIANTYTDNLRHFPIHLPAQDRDYESSWHLYPIRFEKRDLLQTALKKLGVETLIHYPIPPHKQEAYRGLKLDPDKFPVAGKISNELLSLPIGPGLSDKELRYVISCIQSVIPRILS